MKDKVVLFPKSSEEGALSQELAILQAQELMIESLFDGVEENSIDEENTTQDNVSYLMVEYFSKTH